MASRTATALCFITCLIVLPLPFSASSRILPSDSDKVSVGIYCEAMCPFCSRFIAYYIDGLIKDEELFSIVDFFIVPWGNAQILSNGTWDCEHGPYECFLNTVQACAINAWPKLDNHLPFIRCLEGFVYESLHDRSPINKWMTCFNKLGLDPKPVIDCATNGQGIQLELQYAAKTAALQPPIDYVPWVVVDGQPLGDYPNYISYICKAYKGPNLPKACSNISLYNTEPITEENSPVSYKRTAMSTLLEGGAASL